MAPYIFVVIISCCSFVLMHGATELSSAGRKIQRGALAPYMRQKNSCNLAEKRTLVSWPGKMSFFLGNAVMDALWLHRYIFSSTSACIATGFLPFYLTARTIDEDVQSRFYDSLRHKNVEQLPSTCHKIAKSGIAIPMIGLSSLMFFAHDEDLRTTARVYAIGLPFVHSGKDAIKAIKTKACLRPWHESFSCEKRSSGGFPSGHMANVAYTATLFGMRHGLKFGVPLGLFSAFVLVDFVNCNRHYISQLIAGAGLGMVYAFAANKVVERHITPNFTCCLRTCNNGAPGISLAYKF